MKRRLCWVCLTLLLPSVDCQTITAADATFVIDPQASSLTIEATTRFGFTFSDSDTQSLEGTIDADFDFGTSGSFPEMADFIITGAAISPSESFSLTLGIPPSLGIAVSINNAVTDVQTRNPPALLTSLPTGLVRYEFDAAEFDIILNQGSVVATGIVSQSLNLAEEPVSGAADPGTTGQITFLDIQTNGPITEIDAQLALPITFSEVFDIDGQLVTLDVSGNVFANANFPVVLSSLPGDFDEDTDVDGSDFLLIQRDYPSFISTWQPEYPSALNTLTVNVPEPTTISLGILAAVVLVCKRSRSEQHLSEVESRPT